MQKSLEQTKTTGDRLADYMASRGIRVAQLSEISGVNERAITRVRANHKPHAETLYRIAAALNISLDWLCFGVGVPDNSKPEYVGLINQYREATPKIRNAAKVVLDAGKASKYLQR